MEIRKKLGNWLLGDQASEAELRNQQYNLNNAILLGLFGNNPNGDVTEEVAMQIPALNSGISLITSTIAKLPVQLYRTNSQNEIHRVYNDNRLRLLNSEPNEFMNGYNFKKQIVKDYIFYGSAYIVMVGVGNQKESLHVLPSKDVTYEKYVKNGFINYAEIYYKNPDTDEQNRFKFHEMIIPLRDTVDGISGQGILHTGNEILKLALEELLYSSNLLQNGALPMSVLETATKLSNEAARRLKDSFENNYAGAKNSHKTLLLEEGLKYKPVSLKPNELELTSARQHTISDIARLLNIPESMINSEANKYSSNEQNNIHFLQYCIAPILSSIENALNKSLLLESEKATGYYFKFDTSGVLQTTELDKIRSTSEGLKSGIFTINEARRRLDLKDITKEDYYSRSLGDIFINTDSGTMLIPNLGKAIDPSNLKETMLSDKEIDEIQDKLDDEKLNNESV